MGWFTRKPKNAAGLIGRWIVDPTDRTAVDALGNVALEFDERGNLIYVIKSAEQDQVILMTYRIDGDIIISDQPSHPNPQRTDFSLDGDTLTLRFEGQPSRFVRVSEA